MHIAIAGPIATEDVKHLLGAHASDELPMGYPGAPLLATLITELLRRGHRVSAFTTSVGMPISRHQWISGGDDDFRIHYIGQRPHAFRPKHGYLGRAMDIFSVERAALVAAISRSAPDVVNGHWSYEFGLAAIESGLPHVVSCHDAPAAVLKYMPNRYRLVRYFMARHCLRKARHVTAVSPYLRSAVQKYCRTPVTVVQNPLPASLLAANDLAFIPERINKQCRRIAMVLNGWGRLKNPIPAIEAFSMLRSKWGVDIELHLFGADFGVGERAEHWCTQHDLRDGLVFHGKTEHRELLSQLGAMDLLVHPSLVESCPMGIAEAMSLGLPIVGGSNSGGVPWVIGEGGITTDITDPAAIASSVEALLRDDSIWRRCASAAKIRSHSEFSPRLVADLYEEQYRRAISDRTTNIGRR